MTVNAPSIPMRTAASSDPGRQLGPQAPLRRTPALALGPFYPLDPPGDTGRDLWHGATLPAGARRLALCGRVLSALGSVVEAAEVELWHADPQGRYRHPSAPTEASLAGFSGYGRVRTDAQGRFEFRSIVPGAYADEGVQRAPHLHVQITGRFDRLITQLFFPGHPGNQQDRWYRTLRHPRLVTPDAEPAQTEDSLTLRWTAVLTRG